MNRDTQNISSDNSAFKKTVSAGIIVGVLIGGAGAVVKLFSPETGIGDGEYVITGDGTQYVKYADQWHETMNTASARLILGKPDNPKKIKTSALKNEPRGQMMGILGAPGSFNARADEQANWAACTQYSPTSRTNLLDTSSVDTIIISGHEINNTAHTLQGAHSIIVRDMGTGDYWVLLSQGVKLHVDPRDERVMNALELSQDDISKATNVSTPMLSTLRTLPELAKPDIQNYGETSTAISQYRVGNILDVSMPGGHQFYMVGDKGVQKVSPFIARWVSTTGGTVFDNISPDKVSEYPAAQGVINVEDFPQDVPQVDVGKSVCSVWSKSSNDADARATVTVADMLPLDQEKSNRAVELMPSVNTTTPTANFSYSQPGRGWFVRVTGLSAESLEKGGLYWVSDIGVAYPIAPGEDGKLDSTVSALGVGGRVPLTIPQEFLSLFTPGPSLSPVDARVMHANPSPDGGQVPLQDDKGKQSGD